MFLGNKKCRIYAACGVSQTPKRYEKFQRREEKWKKNRKISCKTACRKKQSITETGSGVICQAWKMADPCSCDRMYCRCCEQPVFLCTENCDQCPGRTFMDLLSASGFGLIIVFLYQKFGKDDGGPNQVFLTIRSKDDVPLKSAPLILYRLPHTSDRRISRTRRSSYSAWRQYRESVGTYAATG